MSIKQKYVETMINKCMKEDNLPEVLIHTERGKELIALFNAAWDAFDDEDKQYYIDKYKLD